MWKSVETDSARSREIFRFSPQIRDVSSRRSSHRRSALLLGIIQNFRRFLRGIFQIENCFGSASAFPRVLALAFLRFARPFVHIALSVPSLVNRRWGSERVAFVGLTSQNRETFRRLITNASRRNMHNSFPFVFDCFVCLSYEIDFGYSSFWESRVKKTAANNRHTLLVKFIFNTLS